MPGPETTAAEPESVSARLRYAKSGVPEGRCGEWVVERFVIRDRSEDLPAPDPRPAWVRARPGVYTRLRAGSVDYMTDLYEEWWSQRTAMTEAVRRGGDVLITGLGLGMVAETILRSEPDSVRSVTVLERSPEVISLVGPHLGAEHAARLAIVEADAFEWSPPAGARFSVVWHDIWPNPFDPASITESQELMDRYARWADWQGSWALEYRGLIGSPLSPSPPARHPTPSPSPRGGRGTLPPGTRSR